MSLKSILNKLLGAFKLRLITKKKNNWDNLNKIGNYSNHVIVDIGAAAGTPKLYNAFLYHKFILVEPQIEYKSQLDQWAKNLNAIIIQKAITKSDETKSLNINKYNTELSSFNNRAQHSKYNQLSEKRMVESITLDQLTQQHCIAKSRYILKIDVEGFELDVLQSGPNTLSHTDLIIIEITFAQLYDEEYNYITIMKHLEKEGFYWFDILDTAYGEASDGIVCADIIYKRKSTNLS